ncbi:heavy metal-associated isoprenylated plant protein 39-like [Chenopodium quinoa]|uniref:heavy metal-associated isoprenylated plant protein 39-like n=1 Tax=Chenopodium quinoa TaxID=63459 RepID=UPI000B773BCF|nr:heavy metal-associated isoprenylated plant protein 39-like [Chenopodium quinoa]
MQKLVVKLDIQDDNNKQNAIKLVSSIPGIDSISMNMNEKKLTVIGDMDPLAVVKKLRKNYYTDIVTVGPAKEPEKPKNPEEPNTVVQVSDFIHAMQAHNSYTNSYYNYPLYSRYNGYARSVEEDPNGCVIC